MSGLRGAASISRLSGNRRCRYTANHFNDRESLATEVHNLKRTPGTATVLKLDNSFSGETIRTKFFLLVGNVVRFAQFIDPSIRREDVRRVLSCFSCPIFPLRLDCGFESGGDHRSLDIAPDSEFGFPAKTSLDEMPCQHFATLLALVAGKGDRFCREKARAISLIVVGQFEG